MKRLMVLLLAWTLLAPAVFAKDPLDSVVPLVQDDLAAIAQAKATGKHALLYFGDQLN